MLSLAPECPSELGSFRLLERIGGGWTSEVYKAALIRPQLQAGVPAVFAVKLSVDKSANEPFRAALWKRHNLTEARLYSFFEREKMLLAMCGSHPNGVSPLLALSDPELVGGHDVVVTELGCLDVGSLQEALPGQKLPLEVIKYVAAQAASACRYIHRNHFAWLDPRLANLVITKDFRCQLVDFAMSWHLPKTRDSIYFGAFLLYQPITGGDVPIDPAEKDVEDYKRVFRASNSLPDALVDLACLLLDGGSMEEACRSAWFRSDDESLDVDDNLSRLQHDA